MRKPLLALCSLLAPLLGAAIDPQRDLLVRWPDPGAAALSRLKELGVRAVFVPFPGKDPAAAARACREAGVEAVAEIESAAQAAELVRRAREAGFSGVMYPAFGEEAALRSFVSSQAGLTQFVLLDAKQAAWNVAPAYAVLRAGLWPGVQPNDPSAASATGSAWIDANSYLVAYLRGLYSHRPAILGYRADGDAGVSPSRRLPFHTVELGLIEAVAAGGNVVLTIPADYRGALLQGDGRAERAWRALANTATFLGARRAVFEQPPASRVALAADNLEEHGELLNMMYRRGTGPAVFPPARLPAFRPDGYRILVAAALHPSPEARKAALAFASAGGQLVVAPLEDRQAAWWIASGARKTKSEEECDLYTLGKGTILAYRAPVADPAEFALDILDAQGWRTRDVRVIGADPVVAMSHRAGPGKLSVEMINYSTRPVEHFLLRVEGAYRKAVFSAPGAQDVPLQIIRQGSGTEVEIALVERLGVVLFE